MRPHRDTFLAFALALVVSALAVPSLAPPSPGSVPARCASGATLIVEVCPADDAKAVLGDVGSSARDQLRVQTLADFVLIASYVGLWVATSLALHPLVALAVGLAGLADVVENGAILFELPLKDPVALVRWAALTKWGLLGIAFLCFFLVFFPLRKAAGPRPGWRQRLGRWVCASTGTAYFVAGILCLVGLRSAHFLDWAVWPLGAAIVLQLVVHLAAHDLFAGRADGSRQRCAAPDDNPRIGLEAALRQEFRHIHGFEANPEKAGLKGLYDAIHNLDEKRSALCLSGGGIRSATFALGVLQGLAKKDLLGRFHYLSTVSGGGYIGSWLSAWIRHAGNDVRKVSEALARLEPSRKLAPEPPEISFLRDYSNYLAPRTGLLSADTWTLVGTLLRNVILIWLVLVPALMAALMVPRFYVALLDAWSATSGGHPPLAVSRLVLGAGTVALCWAVAYVGASIPSSSDERRGQGAFLVLCLAPLLVSAVCLTLYWAWFPVAGLTPFLVFGFAVHMLAYAGTCFWLGRKVKDGRDRPTLADLLLESGAVAAVGLAAGFFAWCVAPTAFHDIQRFGLVYACLAPAAFIAVFLLAATLLVGLLSGTTTDEDREWWARCGAWLLIVLVVWVAAGAIVVFGPLLFSSAVVSWAVGSVGGLSGALALVGGWSARSAARPAGHAPTWVDRIGLPGAAALFLAVVLTSLSLLTSGAIGRLEAPGPAWIGRAAYAWPAVGTVPWNHVAVLLGSAPGLVAALCVGLALAGAGFARLIDTNVFSLHSMYRSRLIRAYLGASSGANRKFDPFTGFAERDDVRMAWLWPASVPSASGRTTHEGPHPPFHVVNVALNLVHGRRLAWQERRAHSFTVSPLHAGSVVVDRDEGANADSGGAYRRIWPVTDTAPCGEAACYGGRGGISLGTAVTISGAAVSPNMGYHSSPLVTFLLTLFNVRLGWWLGNPGKAGDDTFDRSSPRMSLRPILSEAFGLTDDRSPYVYLSDGGHFDNLGLYEMVLRRCHFIVVSDAGCDGGCTFADLGNAVRKIRADLGISIDFPGPVRIVPRTADAAARARGLYWAVGRIRYSEIDRVSRDGDGHLEDAGRAPDGWLLYIKPEFYGSEPPDVYQYAMANDQFPHESTLDQFFSESQFESYRMLGAYVAGRLCHGLAAGCSLDDLVQRAAG